MGSQPFLVNFVQSHYKQQLLPTPKHENIILYDYFEEGFLNCWAYMRRSNNALYLGLSKSIP